jgi:hypothetical protein
VAHLSATIVSLSQDMDLDTGSMANFMMLALPNGKVLRALITDEAAQDIIHLTVGRNGSGEPTLHAEGQISELKVEAHIFGGDDEPIPDRRNEESLPPPPVRKRPKSVDKDELGYPVVHMEGGVDPSELTGGKDRDEDGVGQI